MHPQLAKTRRGARTSGRAVGCARLLQLREQTGLDRSNIPCSTSMIVPRPTIQQRLHCGALCAAPRGGLPRYGNLVLGIWLFSSSWLWPHTGVSRANAMLTGLCLIWITLAALRRPVLRWLNLVAALWLACSSVFVWHPAARTLYNHLISALLVLGVCLCPDPPPPPHSPLRF